LAFLRQRKLRKRLFIIIENEATYEDGKAANNDKYDCE
jgi:hypothetical protein